MSFLLVKRHQQLLSLYEIFEIPNKNISFSKRENEIFHWVSIGRITYQEISKIIGIKKRSIKFHMKNITNKLGEINLRHTIN
ncbi:helix-turn-helix transcriptional regulator [Candidatus Williamhamiltonella defendens]|uniref:helix-turn-helix transcriptional regulator n=1 Tax=Candidatus Williamhamiltonella defendens TaxID=138072 RepID=UPI001F3615B9|nr:LuxR C-terminal-related transcriptional regulator [Candidatus Hamiltonella defensa]